MSKKFDELVNLKINIENKKAELGGIIYQNRNLLPSIIIKEDNLKKIIDDLKMIQKICHQFSEDIVRLHAELFVQCGFLEEKNRSSPLHAILNDMAIPIVGKLDLAKTSAEDLEKKVNAQVIQKKESIIYGEEYCFISIILNELFPIYTGLVSFMLGHTYLDESYLQVIRERTNFLMHPFYEELRKSFKIIEMLKMLSKPVVSETIH